jgi:glycerol kinase
VAGRALLALDLGTTGVRALALDASGRALAQEYSALSVSFPAPGRVEQDPDEMWESSVRVMCAAIASARLDASDLAGIGVVTQRATTLAWDARTGRALAPAIGWQDQRTAERVAWFRERGIPLNTLASATKLEWWLEHEPAVQKAAAAGTLRLGTPDAWLTYRLSGGAVHVTDPGNASCTALYDVPGRAWSEPLLGLFQVPREALPEVVPTSAVVAETPSELLGAAVPVAARAGDQQAACFGQGVHRPGEAKLTLGTSGMLDLHTGAEPATGPPGTYALSLWRLGGGEEACCLEATVITAGAAVDWLVQLGLAPDAAAVSGLAAQVDSSGGVAFVPALQGLGTPYLDDAARGLVIGLTRGTSAAHLSRALLEGIAHRCVDLVEALSLAGDSLKVDGGLARSHFLMQALADFGGLEVERAPETETTARGAAYLAGLATGVFASPEQCLATLGAPTAFRPSLPAEARRAARERWQRAVERARGAYPA